MLDDVDERRGLNLDNLAVVFHVDLVPRHHFAAAEHAVPGQKVNVLLQNERRHDIKKMVKGFMVESYIEDGSQKVEDGVYGKSITDPCLGWEKTKEMIYTIADQL